MPAPDQPSLAAINTAFADLPTLVDPVDAPAAAADSATLRRNLAALRRTQPALADRLADTPPAPLDWSTSKAGDIAVATLTTPDGKALSLASRYDPIKEADRLIDGIDHAAVATVAVLGVGLGYHVQRLVEAQKGNGLAIAYEPDTALLRAVLERVDHSAWLGTPRVIVADGQTDRPALLSMVEKRAGVLTQGLHLVTHPLASRRHPDDVRAFSQTLTEVLAFCRTNVATTLVNSARTVHNVTHNLAHYAAGSTTDALIDAAEGFPAVCVAAGPSLAKNVDLLSNPEVRSRVVVIAVQTALRPLLDRGIRPDFVTAIDYSEISSRFYEDLPALPDVTLVAEPKAHPTILDAYPGPIRCARNAFDDQLLGDLARPIKPIRAATTVAHLCFYLAQHLGCDPIMLIGQDLGFADGLYYCPGTAVHRVWSPELNPFNTVEMLEWTRVARMRSHLQKVDGHDGRQVYTDEQMVTYLKQFERDFAEAPQTIIDCTQGGALKQHTQRMTLADAIAEHATRAVPELPKAEPEPQGDRLASAVGRLAQRLDEIKQVRRASRDSIDLLRQMLKHQRDKKRMDKLFTKLTRHQQRIDGELRTSFELVGQLNTVGQFRRAKADRAIAHAGHDRYAKQAAQIERDIANLEVTVEACDEALKTFRSALDHNRAKLDTTQADHNDNQANPDTTQANRKRSARLGPAPPRAA
ncbi:MAG: 6-hydroxymethylpterin diphosphokinase MptE-like protein [Planctomycetota bacterium]